MRYADNLPFDLADVGQWWGTDPREKKQIQIDIVGVPVQESNQKIAEYLMGSCKFKNEKIGLNELELLERYAMAFAKGEKYYNRNLLGGLYRENPVKSRNYEAVKSSKKWENVGNSYIIPALLLYRYSYI